MKESIVLVADDQNSEENYDLEKFFRFIKSFPENYFLEQDLNLELQNVANQVFTRLQREIINTSSNPIKYTKHDILGNIFIECLREKERNDAQKQLADSVFNNGGTDIISEKTQENGETISQNFFPHSIDNNINITTIPPTAPQLLFGEKRITKKNGEKSNFDLKKCYNRLIALIKLDVQPPILERNIRFMEILRKINQQVSNDMRTYDLDQLIAEICYGETSHHPDHEILAARVLVSRMHKYRGQNFAKKAQMCFDNENKEKKVKFALITKEMNDFIQKYAAELQEIIDYKRDYFSRYFGIKTLMKSYLLKEGGFSLPDENIIESRQDSLMRHAIFLHMKQIRQPLTKDEKIDLSKIKTTYDLLSYEYYTPATPTLQGSGTNSPQLASCFLMEIYGDDIDAIFEVVKQTAHISKKGGGVGFLCSKIRSEGSLIKTTNGMSGGLMPFLRIYNETAKSVDQGGGKRKGAFAAYLDIWCAEITNFLEIRGEGPDPRRCLNLFFGIMSCDLFWERCIANQKWSLFSFDVAPQLIDLYGEEFEKEYKRLEADGKYEKQIDAIVLHDLIVKKRISKGMPYLLNKDEINRKSNQKNLGTIKQSNLCTEIVEYTSEKEIAVCNLSSIAVQRFVDPTTRQFDFGKYAEVIRHVTTNLNLTIDRTDYPLPQCAYSNLKNRPIGIGLQSVADCLILMHIPFKSKRGKKMIAKLYEYLYFYSLERSCELAQENGNPYDSYAGSPISKGILQFDMWRRKPEFSPELDYVTLRKKITQFGVYNSEFTAQMPTASTSQILSNNESFEPHTSNYYTRVTMVGRFPILNRHLIKDLEDLGLWNAEMRKELIDNKGSVQSIATIPEAIRNIYKTYYEIDSAFLIETVAAFSPFITQSVSFNRCYADPDPEIIKRDDILCYKYGLKTFSYYTRTNAATDGQNMDDSMSKQSRSSSSQSLRNSEADDDSKGIAKSSTIEKKQQNGGITSTAQKKEIDEFCTREDSCVSCSS